MSVSTSSTACWSSDARSTSAPLDPGRGRGQCARDPDPCNTVTCDASKDTSIPAYCSMVIPHDAWRRRKPVLLVNTITLRDHRQSPEALASIRRGPVTPSSAPSDEQGLCSSDNWQARYETGSQGLFPIWRRTMATDVLDILMRLAAAGCLGACIGFE